MAAAMSLGAGFAVVFAMNSHTAHEDRARIGDRAIKL